MVEWIDTPATLGQVDYPAGKPFGAFVDVITMEDVGFDRPASKHRYARDVIKAAFRKRRGRNPSLSEAQGAQVIALGETSYGRGWSDSPDRCPNGDCSGSHNWGAIIRKPCPPCPNGGALPDCPPGSFIYRDSCPDGSACYQCFRAYANDTEGAEHLIKILYDDRPEVLAAAARGDIHGMAVAMKQSGYYGLATDQYEKAMRRNLDTIAHALNEPLALSSGSGGSRVAGVVKKALPAAAAFAVGGVVAFVALKAGGVV